MNAAGRARLGGSWHGSVWQARLGWAGFGMSWHVAARQAWQHTAPRVEACLSRTGHGRHGAAAHDAVGQALLWQGRQGLASLGRARRGRAGHGTAGRSGHGPARPGWAGFGRSRHGVAGGVRRCAEWPVLAGQGKAGKARLGVVGRGSVGLGMARQARRGRVRPGVLRRGSARQGMARQARQGWVRLGTSRQGVAWRGRRGSAGLGWLRSVPARLGTTRRGKAGMACQVWVRQDSVGCGAAGTARSGSAAQVAVGFGTAGTAGQGPARLVVARQLAARQSWIGRARRGMSVHGSARQARHGSTTSTAIAGEKQVAPSQLGGKAGATHHTRRLPMSESITPSLIIDEIAAETLSVPIIGTSPLIVHNFSEKSKRQMLDAMQGRKNVKQAKDPQAEYEAAFYRIANEDGPDKYGFPVIAFKAATIGAARFYDKSVTMRSLMQCVFVRGLITKADAQQLTEIHGEPHMREDVVRVGVNGTDLRYRPEFSTWSCELQVTYVKSMLSRNSLISLIDAGGMGVGVGEWRPEKSGDFGTYTVDQSRKIEVLS